MRIGFGAWVQLFVFPVSTETAANLPEIPLVCVLDFGLISLRILPIEESQLRRIFGY
jgi:hypothetical protein